MSNTPTEALANLRLETTMTKEVTIATYNINMDTRCESEAGHAKDLNWSVRKAKVFRVIRQLMRDGVDVICLQELRNLPGEQPVLSFLADLVSGTHYQSECEKRNDSDMAFAQAIVYNRKKLFVLRKNSNCHDMGPYGCLLLDVQFMFVGGLKSQCFHVVNTHLPMEEKYKDNMVGLLAASWGKTPRTVICGDFNFFMDKNGPAQKAVMDETFKHAGPAEGTFRGFSMDPFHIPMDKPQSLDHIYVSQNIEVKLCDVVRCWMERTSMYDIEFIRDLRASDHDPVVATLQINFD
jgi:endonuclease/exonuclease/phosphatase family metal-dependent hydrolase